MKVRLKNEYWEEQNPQIWKKRVETFTINMTVLSAANLVVFLFINKNVYMSIFNGLYLFITFIIYLSKKRKEENNDTQEEEI